MPKRTNAFQKLVLYMQRQLGTGSSVAESRMLLDRHSGRAREVDVVVESALADQSVLMCVECVALRRPAGVEWVDRMIGKHRSLPTDVLVLVSESGFSAAAIEKARLENVRAISLADALRADWTTIVGKAANYQLDRFNFSPTDAWLILKGSDSEFPVEPNQMLESEGWHKTRNRAGKCDGGVTQS